MHIYASNNFHLSHWLLQIYLYNMLAGRQKWALAPSNERRANLAFWWPCSSMWLDRHFIFSGSIHFYRFIVSSCGWWAQTRKWNLVSLALELWTRTQILVHFKFEACQTFEAKSLKSIAMDGQMEAWTAFYRQRYEFYIKAKCVFCVWVSFEWQYWNKFADF